MFEIVNNRQIVYGEDKINTIPDTLKWYGKNKVFFVTYDKNAVATLRIVQLLQNAGINSVIYDCVKGEPDLHVIDNGAKIFTDEKCDCTLALGGGSVIDVAKAIGMIALNGGCVEDYQMNGRTPTVTPPLFIAVPTTSGTGAEATKVSVVLNNNNGLKKSLYHTTMIADIAILDPSLVVDLPKSITVSTGMDALSHAIESYVSLNANTISQMAGLKAIELINENLEEVIQNPKNIEARGNMMLGSYLGGCAITAGIGIAHIMAQPLGALFHIPHGDACSIFLPASMELNLEFATKQYATIAHALKVASPTKSDKENALAAIERVKELREKIGAPASLRPYIDTMPSEEELVDTIKRTTGHITCNPRPLDEKLMLEIFNMVL
ncbi:MAG: iron-containing alcohol dehydrogenase [Spirochaetales bacterium]